VFLDLIDLSKHFESRDSSSIVRAVDNINVSISEGQFVTLLGPSGCGKTTTLRLIAGFEFPTTGRIVLDGQEINEQPPNQRDMAMVFQSYALFPHLSVFDNIAYGLKIKKLSKADIREKVGHVLDLTELQGLENRAPNQLSGGQQQRVALARALVMEPKVLLFDEPLSNLDAKLRIQMRTEIRRIQQELGITSVYVTHDQDEAMVLSDMVVIMHDGMIQQSGTAVEIYRHPHNRFVADFIGRANFLPVTVSDVLDGSWVVKLNDITLTIPGSATTALKPGDAALMLARPESIQVFVEPAPSGRSLPGTVRRTSYMGSLAEYDVEFDGKLISVVRHDPKAEDLYAKGTPIHIDFLDTNLYLLPNDPVSGEDA
jgi:iron(III) transport system ATP-binding protein